MSKVVITVAFLVLFFGPQTLSNDSVINLTKAGFSEDMIISAINRANGSYDTSVNGLLALKNAGITNKEIAAIMAKANPQADRVALPVPTHSVKPRVFVRTQSHSRGWHGSRDQAMEMNKDFQEDCPEVQISINPDLLDYIVELNHTESNLVRQNQIQVANKDGDLVSGTEPGRSIKGPTIKGDVRKACEAIVADWARK